MAADEREYLLKLVQTKDTEGFRLLYQHFYRPLVVFAMNYLDDKEEAEDVVEDLFLSLWENHYQFASYERLRNFLYMSVKNSVLNLIKHAKVRERYELLAMQKEQWDEEDDRKMVREEVYRLMFEILDSFPVRCREIFRLALQGKKNEEIAEELGISVLTVKTQKNRGIKILKKRLGHLFVLLPLGILV